MVKYIMYRQLQKQVKEYIISSLCLISDKWKFDIDTENEDYPLIVGYGPNDIVIRTPIELFHNYITPELIKGIVKLYDMERYNLEDFAGFLMVRCWFSDVFEIYGIKTTNNQCFPLTFSIVSKDSIRSINSKIYSIYSTSGALCFLAPYVNLKVDDDRLISPLLLFLDPIKYFRRYSMLVQKYAKLVRTHTFGIYELLLEYFPDVMEELIAKCWLIKNMFWDLSTDIGALVIGRMIVLL